MGQSGVEKHLQLLWKSTAMAPLLVGLAGCWWRPVESPPIVTPAAPAPAPATPEVLSVADAEGKTHVTLPPRPDLHPGDVLHIRAADRLIATALVTVVDADHSEALVVALTDRRRPVQVHDTFGPPAPDADPPPADPAELARQQATSRIALSQALAAPAAPVTPPPVAPTLAMDAAVEHAPAATTPTTAEAHADAARTPAAGPVPVEMAAPAVPAPDAGQEVRARLEAERAYWDLASRVLRLPPAGPELAALQERLRQEFAVQEAKEAPAAKEAAQPAAKEAPKDAPAHDAAPAGATEAHEVKPATEPANDAAAHEAKPETHEATTESHEAKPEAHDAKPSHDDAHAEHQDAKP